MRTYYLRCLCESLLNDRLREAAFGEDAGGRPLTRLGQGVCMYCY